MIYQSTSQRPEQDTSERNNQQVNEDPSNSSHQDSGTDANNKRSSSFQKTRGSRDEFSNISSPVATRPQPPRHPRPIRPNLRRQIVVASRDIHSQASVPIGTQIELATVLPSRAKIIPPQRPAHLPARYDTYARSKVPIDGSVGLANTSCDSADVTGKPNRYAWARMQQWQEANAAQNHPHRFQHHFSSAASRVLIVNPMQMVNLSEHTKSRLIKIIEALKRFSEKWFSHVLLLMFLAVYACFGAYIFISFEAPTEQWEKQLIIDTRLKIVNDSWQDARDMKREQFVDSFRLKFEEYERILNRVCASGMTSSSLENQWTFWGALFYSMTVFTTIGYGHLTPITFAGRCATMVYAIFGIPILLMVLADLGKLLTRIIKSTFKKFRYLYNKLLGRRASIKTRKLISDNTSQYIGVARKTFERGFAYIQPYNKLPHAFRGVSFKLKNRSHLIETQADMIEQQVQQKLDENPEEKRSDLHTDNNLTLPDDTSNKMNSHLKRDSVITDVILTPVNQTKPVSPHLDEKKTLHDHVDSKGIRHNHHHHNTTQNQHHRNPHGRAQSPGKAKRKISSTNKPGGQQVGKFSLSRSSSTHNMSTDKGKVDTQIEPTNDKTNGNDTTGNQTIPEPPSQIDMDKVKSSTGLCSDLEASDEGLPCEEYEDIDDDFDIPVSFALFLLVTYMMFGAVVFSIWEGWNFFDALYFVFISMSTIGFGDLVPQHPKRMIGTFIYLLLGLALTSMCINVVQEKIHATFLRAKMQIGEKMGLDLDQIMADDYYDGSLALDEDDDSNSVAISQTNSSLVHANLDCDPTSDDLAQRKSRGLGPLDPPGDGAPGVKLSRSRDSLKYKRRTGVGGGIFDQGGSFRRKASRKISRQSTPLTTNQLDSPSSLTTPNMAPVTPSMVQTELCKVDPPIVDHEPSINMPVDKVKSFCEPLERIKAELTSPTSSRPKLLSTRSQPSQVTKSLSSGPQTDQSVKNNPNYRTASMKLKSNVKSEGSSRRASVSHELNQLDDLIKALTNQSPSERFGPLLGIPSSTRTSRSNSPNSQQISRRGTSMTERRPVAGPSRSPDQRRGVFPLLGSSSQTISSISSEAKRPREKPNSLKNSAV